MSHPEMGPMHGPETFEQYRNANENRITELGAQVEELKAQLSALTARDEQREAERAAEGRRLAAISKGLSQEDSPRSRNMGADLSDILSAREQNRPSPEAEQPKASWFQRAKSRLSRNKTDASEAPTATHATVGSRQLNPRDPNAPRNAEKKRRNGKRLGAIFAIGAAVVAVVGIGYAAEKGGDNEKAPKAKVEQIDKTASNDTTTTKDGPAPSLTASAKKATLGIVKPLTSVETASAASETTSSSTDSTPKLTWETAGSVDRAVLRLKSANDTQLKSNVHKIYDAHAKLNSNKDGKMSALKSFTAESTTKADAVEAANLAAVAQMAYATPLYNNLKGLDADTPATKTHAEMLKFIEKEMTAKDTKFVNDRINGNYQNHGIKNDKLFSQGLQANNIRVVRMIAANGNEVIFKIGGGNDANGVPCINILEKMKSVVTYHTSYTHPTTAPVPKQTTDIFVPTPKHHNKPADTKDHTPKHHKPESDKPVDTSDNTPGTPKPPKAPEKKDDGHLPGNPNVPADQDKGTPDKAGTAPATPGNSPSDVPRQPQDPTPAPQQPSSTVNNSPPAETGTGPANTDPKGSTNTPGTSNTDNSDKGGNPDTSGI